MLGNEDKYLIVISIDAINQVLIDFRSTAGQIGRRQVVLGISAYHTRLKNHLFSNTNIDVIGEVCGSAPWAKLLIFKLIHAGWIV